MNKPIVIDEDLKKMFQIECIKSSKQMKEVAEEIIRRWLEEDKEGSK